MTLGECFEHIGENPQLTLFYFLALPILAILAGVINNGEQIQRPGSYLYSALVYMITIPGIFAVTLNVYLFLFERQPIFDANIYTQILPIASMIATLWIISKSVRFSDIPGFNKISGLIMILFGLIALMWVLEKTHIFIISFLPFQYFLIGFIIMLVLIRLGWSKMYGRSDKNPYSDLVDN